MSATISSTGVEYHKVSHTSFTEKLRVWFINAHHWRTKWAVSHLSKQLKRDPEFRELWKANISMPIYDSTRGNHATHARIEGGGVAIFVRYMPIEQANYIADRLMKHLFGA